MSDGTGSDLEWHLSRAGEVITGTYRGNISEAVQESDCGLGHHCLYLDLCQAPSPTSLVAALLPSWVGVPVLGGRRAHTER